MNILPSFRGGFAPRCATLATLAVAGLLSGCSGARDTAANLPAAASGLGAMRSVAQPDKKPVEIMYLADRTDAAILGWPSNATGNVAPAIEISGANTQITNPVALTTDAQGNIYTLNDSGRDVLIFPAGSNGNVTPAVLGGSNIPLQASEGVAVDASGQIYVSDFTGLQILVFAKGATGNTPPIRTISGPNTGLTRPIGMAFDAQGNLYVANYNGGAPIVEFSPTANGNAAPIGTISGSKTTLFGAFNLAITARGGIVVENAATGAIDIFKNGAQGNVKPNVVISGSATGLASVGSVGLDSAGYIYAATHSSGSSAAAVRVFKPSASGNAAPIQTLVGTNTLLENPFYPSFAAVP